MDAADCTVSTLAAEFWQRAETYYRRPDGTSTSSQHNYRLALRPLTRLYGRTRVSEFTPRALRTVRQQLIHAGWNRGVINQAVGLIRSVFRLGSLRGAGGRGRSHRPGSFGPGRLTVHIYDPLSESGGRQEEQQDQDRYRTAR